MPLLLIITSNRLTNQISNNFKGPKFLNADFFTVGPARAIRIFEREPKRPYMIQSINNSVKLVVLRNPSECWNDPILGAQCRDMFAKMVGLKLAGYSSRYGKSTLPLDVYDFFSTHLLLCKDYNGQLEPILGYKSVTYSECELYHQPLPLVATFESCKAKKHLLALQELIAQYSGRNIRYCLSYTILPKERQDKAFNTILKEMMAAVFVHFIRETQTDLATLCGVTKFKVDQMFMSWGYEPIQYKGKALPPYMNIVVETEALACFLRKFSPYAESMAQKYQDMWDSRVEVGLNPSQDSMKIAA